MNPWFYRIGRRFAQFAWIQCLDSRVLYEERLNRQGPYLIACTHVGHVEPVLISCLVDRPVRWVAREEYHRNAVARKLLDWSGAIPIRRSGPPPVSAMRRCVGHLHRGEVVGIFPEGGVQRRDNCIFRGGINRQGAVVMAMRSGAPIVPVVLLGTEKLNTVDPWFPGRHGKLWIGVGDTVLPKPCTRSTRREVRRQCAIELQSSFINVYRQMLSAFQLKDSNIP